MKHGPFLNLRTYLLLTLMLTHIWHGFLVLPIFPIFHLESTVMEKAGLWAQGRALIACVMKDMKDQMVTGLAVNK